MKKEIKIKIVKYLTFIRNKVIDKLPRIEIKLPSYFVNTSSQDIEIQYNLIKILLSNKTKLRDEIDAIKKY